VNLSETTKQELYNVISAEIIAMRVEIQQNPEFKDIDVVDSRLFDLNEQIWQGVKTVLKFKD